MMSSRKAQDLRHTSKIIIQFYKHIHFIALFRCHINLLGKLLGFFGVGRYTFALIRLHVDRVIPGGEYEGNSIKK